MSYKHKIFIFIFAATAFVAGYAAWALLNQNHIPSNAHYTFVRGLQPGAILDLEVSYLPEYNGSRAVQDKPVKSDTFKADAEGTILLPSMQPYYKSMTLRSKAVDGPVQLKITNHEHAGRLGISGDGFSRFSEIVVESKGKSKIIRTDWAGLFEDTQSASLDASGYTDEEALVRVAFSGHSFSDALDNPAMIEVVIGQGGGPTNADVNIYDPPIHDANCGEPLNSVDGVEVFRPSTCDVPRMRSHIEGTIAGTLTYNIVQPLMAMTAQFSAVMMQQMFIIGTFFDAKEQLEAQRDFQQLMAEAHKDYHPSELMCEIGSYVRSVSQTEERSQLNKGALNKTLNSYYVAAENMSSSEGSTLDAQVRLEKFKTTYCDPNDAGGGLWEFCRGRTSNPASNPSSGSAAQRERFNSDIDYFRTLEGNLTLDVNFTDDAATPAEEDVIALAKNLYWPKAMDLANEEIYNNGFEDTYPLLLSSRNIIAKYNIAHNSFAAIVGMKSSPDNVLAVASGPAHMKSFLRDFGLSDPDIEEFMGTNPSYYAQMDFITKKIYQHPNFYTALYDKPANVDRVNVSLEAFQLMQGRDHYESMLRQEMLISMLVEQEIMKKARDVNGELGKVAGRPRSTDPSGF